MHFNIRVTQNLTAQMLDDCHQLLRLCWQYDGTYRTPYLDNSFNFDKGLPCFYLAYEGAELLGFLAVYADDKAEAELSLYVAPAWRKKGVAKALYLRFCRETSTYPFEVHSFVTETVFLDKNPQLPICWALEKNSETELLLKASMCPAGILSQARYSVALAEARDVEAIAHIKAEAFENTLEFASHYAKGAFESDDILLYVLRENDEVLGVVSVDISTDTNYIFGLAVKKDRQGQGVGTHLVTEVMRQMQMVSSKPFELAVDKTNHDARKFYEKLGFTYQTEVVYLDKKGKGDKEIR